MNSIQYSTLAPNICDRVRYSFSGSSQSNRLLGWLFAYLEILFTRSSLVLSMPALKSLYHCYGRCCFHCFLVILVYSDNAVASFLITNVTVAAILMAGLLWEVHLVFHQVILFDDFVVYDLQLFVFILSTCPSSRTRLVWCQHVSQPSLLVFLNHSSHASLQLLYFETA